MKKSISASILYSELLNYWCRLAVWPCSLLLIAPKVYSFFYPREGEKRGEMHSWLDGHPAADIDWQTDMCSGCHYCNTVVKTSFGKQFSGVNPSDSTTTDDDDGEGEFLALALVSVDVFPPPPPSSPTKSTRHFLLAEVNRLMLLLPTEGAEITWCWSLLRMTTAAVGLLRSVQMTAGASKKPLVCSALKVYSCWVESHQFQRETSKLLFRCCPGGANNL